MTIRTVLPVSTIAATCSVVGAASAHEAVDETVANGDTDYLLFTSGSMLYAWLGHGDTALHALGGKINKVTLKAEARSTTSSNTGAIGCLLSSTDLATVSGTVLGVVQNTSYHTYSWDFPTDPSGQAWNAAAAQFITFNIIAQSDGGADLYFTKIWLEIDYTAMGIAPMYPSGTGALTDFTPNTGTGWQAIDDLPASPDDATTYIQASGSSTYTSTFLHGSHNLHTLMHPNIVRVVAKYRKETTTSSASTLTPVLYKAGTTKLPLEGAHVIANDTNWHYAVSDFYLDTTNANWTLANIDATQYGVQSAPGGDTILVTQIWAEVFYGVTTNTYSLKFTPIDVYSTASGEIAWQFRTEGGTVLASGTGTHNVEVTGGPFTDSTLVLGANNRVIRLTDGAGNTSDTAIQVFYFTAIITPTSITSSQAFGTPTVTPGAVTVHPSSASSSQAFGTSTVTPGAVTVSPSSITTAQGVGSPIVVDEWNRIMLVTSVTSNQAFGTQVVAPGVVTVGPTTGIAGAASVSSPVVTAITPISGIGLASNQNFGTVAVDNGASAFNVESWHAETQLDIAVYPNDTHIDSALRGIYGVRVEYPRMYRSNTDGQRLEDISHKFLEASINATRSNSIARTATFVFRDAEGLNFKTDWFMPCMVLNVNGIEVEFQQGIFQATVPSHSYSENGETISAQASDLGILFAEQLTYPYTVPAGSNYVEAVRVIANMYGITRLLIPPTSKVTPNEFTWNTGSTAWSVINDLLQGINYLPGWFCSCGFLRSSPRVGFSGRSPDVSYDTSGHSIVFGEIGAQENLSDIKNEVIVQVNDPLREPFGSTYYIENPESPVVIPPYYQIGGFSDDDYFIAYPPGGVPAGGILNPDKLWEATPFYPSTAFQLGGAMSFCGWFTLNPDITIDTVIGGMWGEAGDRSFLLRASSTSAGHGPSFVISPDGTSEEVVQAGPVPEAGHYFVMGAFNPGGVLSTNLVPNGDFESGLTAPGASWTVSGDTANAVCSWDTGDKHGGERSLKVQYTPVSGSESFLVSTRITSGFRIGHPVYVSLWRRFTARSGAQKAGAYIGAYGAANTWLGNVFVQAGWTGDSDWSNHVEIGQVTHTVVPEGTAYLKFNLWHRANGSTGPMTCKWDDIVVKDAQYGEQTIYVINGDQNYADIVTTVTASTSMHQGDAPLQIGATPSGGNAYYGDMHDVALYYGTLTGTDAALIAGGMWPANIPWCIAHWHMDTKSQQPLNDTTSRGFTLFPVGTPTYLQPHSYHRRDRFRASPAEPYNIPRMVDQQTADEAARIYAEEVASSAYIASIQTSVDPRRELHEIYEIIADTPDNKFAAGTKWAVEGWSMELRTGGTMTHQVRRVEKY